MQGMFQTAMPLIQEFEGYRDTGYYATDDEKARGIVTVGYGSTHRVGHGEKITEEQANEYLMEDMMEAQDAVDRLVTIELSPNQRAALTSFKREAFGEDDGFVYSGGVKLPGLVNRRSEEQAMFTGMLSGN